MMSCKKRKLLGMMLHSNSKRNEEAEKLRAKKETWRLRGTGYARKTIVSYRFHRNEHVEARVDIIAMIYIQDYFNIPPADLYVEHRGGGL